MTKEILTLQKNIIFQLTVVRPEQLDDTFEVEKYSGPGVLINSKFLNGLQAPNDSFRNKNS